MGSSLPFILDRVRWLCVDSHGLSHAIAANSGITTEGTIFFKTVTLWLTFAACGSALLLATTNLICQDLGGIPLLWVLPLSLYLLSFVICFDHHRWYRRGAFQAAYIVCALMALRTLAHPLDVSITAQIGIYCATLFTVCMICHGELARLKPNAEQPTLFYLMIGAGGALGSALVTLIAPRVFDDFWEFQIALLTCGVLSVVASVRDRDSWFHKSRRRHWILLGSMRSTSLTAR